MARKISTFVRPGHTLVSRYLCKVNNGKKEFKYIHTLHNREDDVKSAEGDGRTRSMKRGTQPILMEIKINFLVVKDHSKKRVIMYRYIPYTLSAFKWNIKAKGMYVLANTIL